MSLEKAKNLVQSFNDGDYEDDIEPYFNNLINFLNFIKKYGILDELDLSEIPSNEFDDQLFDYLVENGVISKMNYDGIPEELKNYFLLYGLENNYEDTMVIITNDLITDVDIRPDGFYLRLLDRDELSNYFCSGGRNSYGAKGVAEKVFSEDFFGHDWISNYHRDPHDTVDELDEANITTLKDIIFKEIGDKELSLEDYDSDFFHELSDEQGTEGYFKIKAEDLEGLVKDEDAFNELCKNELDELGGNLRNLYYSSENTAYEDEVYSLVYDGLNEYFEGRIDDVQREVIKSDGSKVIRFDSYIKIRDFVNNIKTFLEENKGSTYTDSFLEYFGGYTELVKGMISAGILDCIDFRIPEYPDWSMTRKYINEMFHDYI